MKGVHIMKLSLSNIGKIGTADIEIDGITVIAGENNTGKSTVGRALFSVFNSYSNIQNQLYQERVTSVENILDSFSRENRFFIDSSDEASSIVKKASSFQSHPDFLYHEISDFAASFEENLSKDFPVEECVKRITEILNIPDSDLMKSLLEKHLYTEFNGQVGNIFSNSEGRIDLYIKDQHTTIFIFDNHVSEIESSESFSLHTEVIYIDDPFIIDESRFPIYRFPFSTYSDHRSHLRQKLFYPKKDSNIVDEIVTANKLESIYSKLSTVCNGNIVNEKRYKIGYQRAGSDKILDVRNLSTGLKSFVILKTLLINSAIDRNGTIILDEPEIHLHPEWQLLFAELIVLIQKEFNLHVLLNTHSPYFLRAIQVYSAKYDTINRCKYYLSSVSDDIATLEDVTNSVDKIYAKLSYPLQQLENERWMS